MGGDACVIGSWPSAGAAAPRVKPPANVAPLFRSSRRLKRFEPIGRSFADEPKRKSLSRSREYTPVSGFMAALDWSRCPAVESIPGKVGGAWAFKGTRLPVATIIDNLEDLGIDEVIEQFDVSREQITAVLDFVAESLRAEPIPTGARPL